MESCPHFPRADGPCSQKPLTLVEAAKLHGSRVPSTGPPGSSIGALDNGHIHPPRGPLNLSGLPWFLTHWAGVWWGASVPSCGGPGGLGQRRGCSGRADPGYKHSLILGHSLRVYHVQGTAWRPAASGQLGTAFALIGLTVHRHSVEIKIAFATEDPHEFWENHSLLASTMCNTVNPRPHLSPTITAGSGMDQQVKQPDKKALLASFPAGACRHHNLLFLFFMTIWGCDPGAMNGSFFN